MMYCCSTRCLYHKPLRFPTCLSDISWQTSLASSAVAAAEDVRKAVRVCRTASNAKAAASSAAYAAQNACEAGGFANIDEARAAQTRASISQSHAIHAAVVEHEARTVKRRAALALANDVKCWNNHRKRELLKSCIGYARSQHEATRRGVDAWSSLRDGFIESTVIPSALERKPAAARVEITAEENEARRRPVVEQDEVSTMIYDSKLTILEDSLKSGGLPIVEPLSAADPEVSLPFVTADPIPEADEDVPAADHSAFFSNKSESEASPTSPSHETSEDKLSASMQSLVEGLMSWGGGFDAEDDHFALPAGIALGIAAEENEETNTGDLLLLS